MGGIERAGRLGTGREPATCFRGSGDGRGLRGTFVEVFDDVALLVSLTGTLAIRAGFTSRTRLTVVFPFDCFADTRLSFLRFVA
jgi:hypothetical protein